MLRRLTGVVAMGALIGALAVAPATLAEVSAGCPTLDTSLPWYGENRQRLQQLVDAYGRCARPDSDTRPVAVFDWDNTVVKNDVGDATFFWLLRNGKVRQPAGRDWRTASPYLTEAAAGALRDACAGTPPGQPLPTGTDTDCAAELLAVYADGRTTAGAAAFAGYDRRRMEPTYAWVAQLLAGWTPQQVRGFAEAARRENLAAPIGTTQTVGGRQVTGWVRYYDQVRDLIGVLKAAGFDVWISSASPQPIVEVWAAGVGLSASRVIGIRNTVHQGRYTSGLLSCGGAAPGTVINYIDGKRCWINTVVFGVDGAAAYDRQPVSRRAVFAAGDSVTDVTFVRDATALRLAVNRNKAELMCHAYANQDGRWLVNPMFIQPKSRLATPYPCATTAYTDSTGAAGPVYGDDGTVIPDQEDTAY